MSETELAQSIFARRVESTKVPFEKSRYWESLVGIRRQQNQEFGMMATTFDPVALRQISDRVDRLERIINYLQKALEK